MVLKLISVKERLEKDDTKPPEPIVSGLLFRKSMAVLGAPDDSFKTHFTLQLAISLTLGIPCYSYSCKSGIVVYLIIEGGEDYILERLEEKISALGLDRDKVMGRIYIMDCSNLQLDDKKVADDISGMLLALKPKPDVIIFDPITYALNEDVRFSPQKVKLCRNLIGIASELDSVVLPVVHCRKDTQDNENMDDFLGTSIVAAAAATRIKLFRKDNLVNMYAKTRYAERPEKMSLAWNPPLLTVAEEILKPKVEARRFIMSALGNSTNEIKLGDLLNQASSETGHNPKTVRAALDNLAVEGKVKVDRLPKSAIKIVRLVPKGKIYAS